MSGTRYAYGYGYGYGYAYKYERNTASDHARHLYTYAAAQPRRISTHAARFMYLPGVGRG